jgi:hypothetical protein
MSRSYIPLLLSACMASGGTALLYPHIPCAHALRPQSTISNPDQDVYMLSCDDPELEFVLYTIKGDILLSCACRTRVTVRHNSVY